MFKFNNKISQRHGRSSGVFIVNFENISHFFPSVFIVDFNK